MDVVNYETIFDTLGDDNKMITDKNKHLLFRLFNKKYPKVSLELLNEIDNYDQFFWCKYENENMTVNEVMNVMIDDVKKFLSNQFFTEDDTERYFSV